MALSEPDELDRVKLATVGWGVRVAELVEGDVDLAGAEPYDAGAQAG